MPTSHMARSSGGDSEKPGALAAAAAAPPAPWTLSGGRGEPRGER